jgi:pentatricopeptide repeat protein
MSADHLKVEDFERFLRHPMEPGRAARNIRLVRHLLAACVPCRENLKTAVSRQRGRYDYEASFAGAERSLDAFLAKDKSSESSPEELLAELILLPAEEQATRVATDRRFAFPSVVKHLIEASDAVRYQDAARMHHLAYLARLAAEACPAEAAGSEPRLADLRAQAWRQHGNALRVIGRLREAEEAFATAQDQLAAGTRDPLVRARFCAHAASLRISQRRFAEAVELSEEAGRIYEEIGDVHALASTLVRKAIARLYASEAEEAVRTLNRAIPLIQADRDPHLLLAACHNLVRCYIDLGRPEHALSIYSEMRDLYKSFDDPLIRLRAAWQEGLLLRDLGHLRAAEATLLQARQGFVERELLYEAALVSLDLAAVYLKLQAEAELRQTVAETVPIFRALGVGREVLASLLQLRKLSHRTRQAIELLEKLSSRIEQLPARRALP